ncbi:MAG: DUF4982 domain-containing protein [Thermoguttaceae bacterium]|nr:DUF4982 domain-containing protein [Thermoguttaceae bacterium]
MFRSLFTLRRFAVVAFVLTSLLGVLSNAYSSERTKLIDEWKFRRGDGDEPAWRFTWRNLEPYALATRDQLHVPGKRAKRSGGGPGFTSTFIRENFDDSDWETVDLPHDAAIYEDFSYANQPTQSLLPTSEPLWYRKTFELSDADKGKSIFLDFDGVMSRCGVWINGNFVGGWGYGYTSFRVDATPFVKYGATNTIAVRCGNPPQSSRWYTGNGIYRNVWLVKSNETRVARWGVFVKTLDVSGETAKLSVSVDLERAVDEAKKDESVEAVVSVKFYRRDADGARVGDAFAEIPGKTVAIKPGEGTTATFDDFTIVNAPIWSPDAPNTCMAVTTVSVNGQVVDVDETPFGIRTIKYEPDQGLLVNGKLYELRGFCIHHDLGALGAAYNEQAEKRRLLALKSIGCNAIRLSHNPSAPETVDQLARLGFLVQAEAFDQWKRPQNGSWRAAGYVDLFDNWSEADIRSLIRRDRNCPAIVMWSIGNEIPELGDEPEFVRQAKRLVGFVHEEDPTRPATSACNQGKAGFGEIPKVLDIFGYNYYGRANYAEFHKQNPDVPVYGSEVVCTGTSRSWYVFPVKTSSVKLSDCITDFHQTSYAWFAFGFNPDKPLSGWACPPDYEFEAQDRNPFVCGGFAWTGIDYLGAPFTVDDLSRNQIFTVPEIEARAREEKEKYGAYLCPLRICECGPFDLALFPKDMAYLYKSRWLPDEKTTHILPHWNFPNRIGEVTPVYVFTSGDSAELFLNGKSLGRKSKEEYQYRLIWDDVRYEPGTLRAVSYKNGEVWDEATVETTGAPAALRLRADKTELASDGRDLAFATLEVVDSEGRVVPDAFVDVSFKIEGVGTIVASDSGDATDLTSYRSPNRRSFAGLISVILRSERGVSGKMKLIATADGLGETSVEIDVR